MSKKTLSPAEKAALTRKVRREFERQYPDTCDIARAVLTDSEDVFYYPETTVAAVKANLNRKGNYRNMAMLCKFKKS